MSKPLSQILAETFDTGDPQGSRKKWYVRLVNKQYYGRFHWNSGKGSYIRVGGKYPDKQAAVDAAKVNASL